MMRRWPVLRTVYWSIVGLVLAAIVHISYVLAAPHVTAKTAWRQLSSQLPLNEMKVLPPIRPGAQPLPFMTPDVRYAMCRFDLAAGPLQFKTRLVDPTWLVMLFTAQGENFSTFASSDVQKPELEMTVQPTTEQSLIQSMQTFLTRTHKEVRGPREPGLVITSPSREGILVVRAPMMGIAFAREVEQALSFATCAVQSKGR